MENSNKPQMQLSNAKNAVFLGNPEKTIKADLYALRKNPVIGQPSFYTCPKCGKPVVVVADSTQLIRKTCKSCGTQVLMKGVEKASNKQVKNAETSGSSTQETPEKVKNPTTVLFGNRKKVNARLVWGGLFARKAYMLKEGENWIGRTDETEKSDVMIKDDFMSRRSVCITVASSNKGYLFKLEVANATNPVKVNGQVLQAGQSVYLNYEDYIVMGKTTLFIKQVKK